MCILSGGCFLIEKGYTIFLIHGQSFIFKSQNNAWKETMDKNSFLNLKNIENLVWQITSLQYACVHRFFLLLLMYYPKHGKY